MNRLASILIMLFVLISTPVFSATDLKVNINTATLDQLATLKMIGPAYSKRIVEYRETMGPFEKPEDIMYVKGISEKIFEMNKDRIVIKDEVTKQQKKS